MAHATIRVVASRPMSTSPLSPVEMFARREAILQALYSMERVFTVSALVARVTWNGRGSSAALRHHAENVVSELIKEGQVELFAKGKRGIPSTYRVLPDD